MTQKRIPEHIIQSAKVITGRPDHIDLPFFLFDADSALVKVRTLVSTSKKYFAHVNITVSLQSCSLGIFCRLLAEEGLNVEVCSAEAIQLASAMGFSDDRIILDSPCKNIEDLSLALKKEVLIHIDSISELHQLNILATRNRKRYGVSIKLSPFDNDGKDSQVGISKEEYIRDILPLLSGSGHLYLKGFHLHIGSYLENSPTVSDTLNDWLPFLAEYMPPSGLLYIDSDFFADCISSTPENEINNLEAIFCSIHDALNSYNPDLLQKWKLIFKQNCLLSQENLTIVAKAFGYKHRYGAKVIQTNLSINHIPPMHNRLYSLTLLSDESNNPSTSEQIHFELNCFENDYLCLQENCGLKEDQHFLIRGCHPCDMQTANEWTCRKLPVYVWLKGNVLTARMPSSILSAISRDLLHREEKLSVDNNIRLETSSRKFAPALYEAIDFNREYFSEFMAWPRFVNHENDTANFLDSCFLAHQKDEEKNYVILFNNTPVGLLSFNSIDHGNKTGYIGYWLDKRAQGNGIITRALKTLVKHYSSHRILKRFVIKCSTANPKSNAVAKRCGFVLEGTLRQAEYLNGIFHDQNIYSWISSDN
ncbi:50S ribosomal protein L7/L12-serine acetyltransferase [Bartonella heixiaziensis]|uniref:50S ribosomal protein L7/L12-serine acetyltransferase n=1 Tax=Bartonella heixiaziensis TaxID=1461000 RepID=UPI003908A89D